MDLPYHTFSLNLYQFRTTAVGGRTSNVKGVIEVATVIPKNNGNYSGNIIIPEPVEHEGVTCDVTSIGERAFYKCSGLTSVTIPNSVTSIQGYAFSNCPELHDVYCYAGKVPSTNSDTFSGSYIKYTNLYVPTASVESYKKIAP